MPKLFTDELRELRRGGLVAELTDKMAELVLAVGEHGKPGKLLLELTVRRASRGASALAISSKVTLKVPNTGEEETLMFASPEGSLFTEDPRQTKLDLKVAPQAGAELKTAPAPERIANVVEQ